MSGLFKPRIVVLDGATLNPGDNSWAPMEQLGSLTIHPRTDESELYSRAMEADFLVTNKIPIPDILIRRLPSLRFIAVTATGFNMIDVAAARRCKIPVSNVPEYGTSTVAQYTFALILELCHAVGKHAHSVEIGEWQRSKDWCYWLTPQIELTGKKIGIVGFGRIGRRVGELAHAFGMEVLATPSSKSQSPEYRPFQWMPLDKIASEADFLTLHCPLTDTNKQMINDALIRLMKPSAFLINTARGGLIHESDLADHLNRGTIAGAAVDVVSAEPMCPDNPLLKAKNCIITPHIAWAAVEARKRLMNVTVSNIKAFLAGTAQNVVNP